jgi:hypothetical protein
MVEMRLVALNRSHLRGAAELHGEGRVWCYRGKGGRGVLKRFYDAYANRDFTVGTAGLEGSEVVGVICGTTDAGAPLEWLKRRRPWRSPGPRLFGGAHMPTGGWAPAVLEGAGIEGRPVYLLAAAAAPCVGDNDLKALMAGFEAAAASRGATHVVVPAAKEDEDWSFDGFDVKAAETGEGETAFFFRVKAL